ncbi:hypothetical protein J1605_009242 [Eschrichtius robustus]|uniref:GPI ethanolamine phosphate transferase 2 C-terminal domain-containing protein n=1 Tax=Eschrichtius robustus TaxID=9764 RepID=A0AB34GWK1_ESCRO|nr:hypothetical protein J1605_009242 [Eschrichtius robustus]
MTGSLPGFIDVVRNLNSPMLLEDSVITRAKAAGKRIIFYGDETWVDDNVTRHLDKVLKRRDWDVLILHYLGLDHIGHVSGPSSPLIGRKLSEMDSVLMKIHTSLLSERHLLLLRMRGEVCVSFPAGLRGLPDCGGAGPPEIHPHPRSAGCPLTSPKGSVGRLIFPVVEGKPMREQLRFLHLNTVQLSKLLQENVPSYRKEPGFEQFKVSERLHGNWIRLYLEENNSEVLFNLGSKVRRQYLDALRTLSLSLSRQAAQYDVYSMAAGTVLVLEVVALLLLCVPQALSGKAELDVPLLSPVSSLLFYLLLLALAALHVVVCTSSDSSCYLCSLPWLAAGGVMVLISTLLCAVVSALTGMFAAGSRLSKNPPPSNPRWSELDLLILSGTVGHVLSLGASSFIEEEHQTWYFLVNTLCLALCHEIYRNCFVGDDCAPQRCPHAGEEFDGVAAAPQGKSTGPDVWELDRASKHPSPLEALRGPERWMVLASPWVILSCCRLLRSLNQTGVQWAHRPDLGHWLTSSDHKAELSLLATVSLIMIFVLVQKRCSLASKVAMAFGLLGIYCYRVAVGNLLFPWQQNNKDISKGITEARFVYVFVLGVLFTGTKDLLKSQITADDFTVKTVGLWEIYSGLVLLAALLLRPHNLPVLALSLVTQTVMTHFVWRPLRHDAAEVTVMHYWFGQAFFYFQGNSNSIATVDISAGFVGLDAYVEIPAVLLTAFATYTGPVLWAGHLVNFLASEASSGSALTMDQSSTKS